MGTNAVSHHPPGSQLPITVLLFLTDPPANPSQRAAVKIQTHLDNAVTLPLKCLSLILLSERRILSSALCFCPFTCDYISHTNTGFSNIFHNLSYLFALKMFYPYRHFPLNLSQFSLFFPFPLIFLSLSPSRVFSSRQRHPAGDH